MPSHIGLVAVGGANWMGGVSYVRNLAEAIRVAAPATKITYLVGEPLAKDWTDVAPRASVAIKPGVIRKIFGGARSLSEVVRKAGVEFAYPFTYDNEYNLGLGWPLQPQLGSAAWAGWIPDFQHRHLPELFSKEELERRDDCIGHLVEEAPRVVFSSESAVEDFARFYPAHRSKAQVLRFAVPPPLLDDDAPAKPGEPERFLLVCNQFWKHKNHLVVFDALRILRDRAVRPVVLCTGRLDDYRDDTYGGIVRETLSQGGLGDQVQLLGLVPRHEQIRLMRRAVAIIQPSLFEGWSTVVEDARTLGRPTLLSDIAVHREQNPPGAHYFSPLAPERLADMLSEVWKDWPAGPDDAGESLALPQAQTRLTVVGRRFLEIASRAR
jgi:glycosyltransferase involved in cell wall biosynthesis